MRERGEEREGRERGKREGKERGGREREKREGERERYIYE